MKILMVAAENDSIPGGKVGGIGDVVRDIPAALAAAGHHVDVVDNGADAVDAVQHGSYDAVLMYVQMPVMDGMDATRAIRQ